jgi:hypothetical protein
LSRVNSFNRQFHAVFQYADDVARMFIGAARASDAGAAVCNLPNDVVTVADFISINLQPCWCVTRLI